MTTKAKAAAGLVIASMFAVAVLQYRYNEEMNAWLAARPWANGGMWAVGLLAWLWTIRLELRKRSAARRAARVRSGLCGACGYDLRETPHRCPECGADAGPNAGT